MLSPTRLAAVVSLLLVPVAFGASGGDGAQKPRLDANPCLKSETARKLRCPDMRMSPPANLYLTRGGHGHLLLHAENSINSMGRGPIELHGRRDGRFTMAARQAIYRTDGTRRYFDTGARLGFKAIPGQYRYWKFIHAARFELWRLNKRGVRTKLARVGPKQSYCLRDLQHRNPQLPRSPASFHYPGCSQVFGRQTDVLGTSVGWSDVYPSTYHEQYINVSGLSGCFAYVHVADPKNGVFESNEENNEGETIVRLPWLGPGFHGCPHHSRGLGQANGGAQAPEHVFRRTGTIAFARVGGRARPRGAGRSSS